MKGFYFAKKTEMIITFSNKKGGVGKSSLCVSLANYWANQGRSVCIFDADEQATLLRARNKDMRAFPECQPLFEIRPFIIKEEFDRLGLLLENFKKEEQRHYLFDLPGGSGAENLGIVTFSDYVIVPFQYEEFSIDSTGVFATVLQMLEKMNPALKRTAIFVPNMVDVRIGRVSDRKRWDDWDKSIDAVAIRSPRIPLKVCMQRRNTLFMSLEEQKCVLPCFEFITNQIFKN